METRENIGSYSRVVNFLEYQNQDGLYTYPTLGQQGSSMPCFIFVFQMR